MANNTQIKEFFRTIGPVARKVCEELGLGDVQMFTCICQAACESAYGTSKLMVNANAYFGIKATKKWLNDGNSIYNTKTKECYDGKTYTTITDSFRAYPTLKDSVRDYFALMKGKNYKASLTASSVEECITIIKNGGYATDPKYINTIMSIYNKYKDQIECYSLDIKQPKKVCARPTLRKGMSDAQVTILQGNLNDVMNTGLIRDSIYGKLTKEAVEKFQEKHKLVVDGIYGPITARKMAEVL